MEVQMVEFKVRLLNEELYDYNDKSFAATRNLVANDDVIIPPKTDALIPLGITFAIPEGHILSVQLKEELTDKSLGLIGYTFAPQSMKTEFGVMVFNYNKQSIRIDLGDDIVTFNLIKTDDLKITIID